MERVDNLKDSDMTKSARPDWVPPRGRAPRWLRWQHGVVVVGVCGGMVRAARLMNHDEPDSVIPEVGTRATEILEQHEKKPTSPRSRETQHFGHYTHSACGAGFSRMVSELVEIFPTCTVATRPDLPRAVRKA
jgi:hypothetical protein